MFEVDHFSPLVFLSAHVTNWFATSPNSACYAATKSPARSVGNLDELVQLLLQPETGNVTRCQAVVL